MSLPPNLITGRTARLPGDYAPQPATHGGRQRHTPGRMNKREADYSYELEAMKRSGMILDWKYEAVKLRLADRTWYTPDFMVVMPDGHVQFHEVKGHWEDDARVKWKVIKELFPCYEFIEVA